MLVRDFGSTRSALPLLNIQTILLRARNRDILSKLDRLLCPSTLNNLRCTARELGQLALVLIHVPQMKPASLKINS